MIMHALIDPKLAEREAHIRRSLHSHIEAEADWLDLEHSEQHAIAIHMDFPSGPPPVAFDDYTTEAADWAAWASVEEVRAYFKACWRQLPKCDQAAFLRAIERRARR